ncbi:MAG: hypothetical protein IPP19_10015 [Verrucomicrobia bacterium]|nr:hypothetical protein [Verrucomicrobiota bacterium]
MAPKDLRYAWKSRIPASASRLALKNNFSRPSSRLIRRPRRFGGTGLGLAISRQIVELMGGKIGIRPREKGNGSIFWFTVELEQASNSGTGTGTPTDATKRERSVDLKALQGLRILVAEDNAVNQRCSRCR